MSLRTLQRAYRAMFLTCVAVLLMSCEKPRVHSDYDEATVKKLVVPGTTRSEIYSYFGKPLYETKTSNGETVLIYHQPTKSFRTEDLLADKGGFLDSRSTFVTTKFSDGNPSSAVRFPTEV